MRGALLLAAGLCVLSCSGRQKRPPGPPPEYERPQLAPWDSGVPQDPLDDVPGEAVDDVVDEPPLGASDAGASDADAALGDAPLPLDGGVG